MINDTQKPVLFFAFANEQDERARYLRKLPDEVRQLREILEQVKVTEIYRRRKPDEVSKLDKELS